MIAAALVGLHLKFSARESRRGTAAAEMDEGGGILLLLRRRRHVVRAGQNRCDIAVEIN